MAYDPEARQQSNSAMIIGIVALVLLVIGALAYYSTQNTQAQLASTPPVITHTERTEVVPAPASPPPAPVVIDRPVPVPVPNPNPPATKIIERDTHTTITRDHTAPAPATPPASTTNNVTVTVPPAAGTANRTTAQPQAGSDTGTSDTTTTSTTSSGTP